MPDPKPQQTSLDKARSVVEELLGLSKRLGKTGGSSKESSKESESRGHYQQQDDTKHGENKPSLEDEGWEPPEPDLPQEENDTRTIEGVTLLKEREADRTAVQQLEIKEVVAAIFKAYDFEDFVTSEQLQQDMPPNAIVPFQQALGNRMRNEWLLNAQEKMLFLVRLYCFVAGWDPVKNKTFFRNVFFRNDLKVSGSDGITASNENNYPDEVDIYIELWLGAERDLENERLKWSDLTRDRFQEWVRRLKKLKEEDVIFAENLHEFYVWLDKLFDEREVDWTLYHVSVPKLEMGTPKQDFEGKSLALSRAYQSYQKEGSMWREVIRFFNMCQQIINSFSQRSSEEIVLQKLMIEVSNLSTRGVSYPLEHHLFLLLNRHWEHQISYIVRIRPDIGENLSKKFDQKDTSSAFKEALLKEVEEDRTISSIPGLKYQLKEWINRSVDKAEIDQVKAFPLLDKLFASAFLQIAVFNEEVDSAAEIVHVQVNIINQGKMPAGRLQVRLRLHDNYQESFQIKPPLLLADRENGQADFKNIEEKESREKIFEVTKKLLPEEMVSFYIPLERKQPLPASDYVGQLVELKIFYEDRMHEHGEQYWEKWKSEASELLSLNELWDADLNTSSVNNLGSKRYSPLVLPALVCEAGGAMENMSRTWRADCSGLVLNCLIDVLVSAVKECKGYFGLSEWFSLLKNSDRLFDYMKGTRLQEFLFSGDGVQNPKEEWLVIKEVYDQTSSGNIRCSIFSILDSDSFKRAERDDILAAVSSLIRRQILKETTGKIYINPPFIGRLCSYV